MRALTFPRLKLLYRGACMYTVFANSVQIPGDCLQISFGCCSHFNMEEDLLNQMIVTASLDDVVFVDEVGRMAEHGYLFLLVPVVDLLENVCKVDFFSSGLLGLCPIHKQSPSFLPFISHLISLGTGEPGNIIINLVDVPRLDVLRCCSFRISKENVLE